MVFWNEVRRKICILFIEFSIQNFTYKHVSHKIEYSLERKEFQEEMKLKISNFATKLDCGR